MTNETKAEAKVWTKILLVFLPFLVMGLVGAIRVEGAVEANAKALDKKADYAVVEAQYQALYKLMQTRFDDEEQRLTRIEAKQDRQP